jgi:hypothetical protein
MEIKPAKAMHHLLRVMEDWRKEYHTKANGDVVFQNERLLSNIFFTTESFHTIAKHSAGFDNIPEVLMNWMSELTQNRCPNICDFGRLCLQFATAITKCKTNDKL